MTDRGSSLADGAPACPFVAFEDERDERSNIPDHRHRCYAVPRPEPRALAHQEAYCLSPNFAACPIFQDWARREAARTRPGTTIGGLASAAGGREPRGRDEHEDVGPGTEVAAASIAPGDPGEADHAEADPLSSGPAARRRSAGRAWASPPPWAASGGAAVGGAGAGAAAEAGSAASSGASQAVSREEPAGEKVETPAFLATRERVVDDASVAPSSEYADELAGAVAGAPAPRRAPDDRGFAASDERELDEEERYEDRPERPGGLAALAGLGGLFRRDPRPRAGAPRAIRQADIDRGAPAWERPRRYEAYPTLKTRMRMPGLSPIVLGLLALVVAAIVLFALPGFLFNSGPTGGGASPSPGSQASAAPSPTPVPSPTQQSYTIAKGDTLARIAKKFKVTLDQLLAANPQIKDPNKIAEGQVLVIPRPAPSGVSDASSPSPSP